MLPFVVILTCLTGDFEGITDCMSERFLKAGSPTNPKGGIAAVSTATGYTHTCFNNLIDAGIYAGIFADEIYNPGGALVKAKIDLYNNYPDNPYDFVNKLSHWNNLMGDPGLELWTGQPEALTLNCESTIPLGSNNFEVEVLNEEGSPVEDAWVTILKGDDEIFTSGYTDDSGYLRLLFDADIPGTASLTVSKHNYIPEITEVEIAEVAEKAGLQSYSIDDDMEGNSCGNDDGMLNSGEIIELAVSVMNYGYSSLNGLSAQISTNSDNVELLIDSTDLGHLEPGAAAEVEFLFSVDDNTLEGTEIRFDLLILDNTSNEWDDLIYLVVSGPVLEISEIQIEDGNNNILEPGETADLFLFLENIGSVSVEDVFAQISCYDPRITINNPEIEFGDVNAGSEAICSLDPLGLSIDYSVVPGSMINFNIEFYNDQGYQQFNCFSLQAGSVSVTDPLGPDQFGHYIYDSNDLGYTNTMLYDWIEIDPQYGGNGNVISLIDYGDMGASVEVQLPFSFIFYGREYTSLTICTNGWIAPGDVDMSSFMNGIYPVAGAITMIAVFGMIEVGDMRI